MDATPDMVASSCLGKVAFISYTIALLGISRRTKGLVMPYHCTVCKQWHVGSTELQRGRKLQRKIYYKKRERS